MLAGPASRAARDFLPRKHLVITRYAYHHNSIGRFNSPPAMTVPPVREASRRQRKSTARMQSTSSWAWRWGSVDGGEVSHGPNRPAMPPVALAAGRGPRHAKNHCFALARARWPSPGETTTRV